MQMHMQIAKTPMMGNTIVDTRIASDTFFSAMLRALDGLLLKLEVLAPCVVPGNTTGSTGGGVPGAGGCLGLGRVGGERGGGKGG